MRVLVTGGTGYIGGALVRRLERAVVLSRSPERARSRLGEVDAHRWQPLEGPPPAEAFAGVSAIVHLAGESIGGGRWTEERKRAIWESRVTGTRHLVEGLAALDARPRVLVSGSAVGYYGDRGDEILDETAPPGNDYLARLGAAWEAESRRAEKFGMRVVMPRTGLVLGPGSPLLAKMLLPFRLGLGATLGSGRQWMSWIHLEDEVGLLLHAIEKSEIRGAMNAGAPQPVRNREFTRALARALGRPAFLRAPAGALRLALGEAADAALGSQRMAPALAERTGYRFRFATLGSALSDALAN